MMKFEMINELLTYVCVIEFLRLLPEFLQLGCYNSDFIVFL